MFLKGFGRLVFLSFYLSDEVKSSGKLDIIVTNRCPPTSSMLRNRAMSNNKKEQVTYAKPSRSDITRSVATSTAVETGQPSARVEASLDAARKKFAHLRLA